MHFMVKLVINARLSHTACSLSRILFGHVLYIQVCEF